MAINEGSGFLGSRGSEEETRSDLGDPETVSRVFDALPLAAAATVGADHRFVVANETYRRLAGRSSFIGRPLSEVFPEFAGQRIYEMYDKVYAERSAQVGHEWRMQVADESGSVHDRYFDFVVTPWQADSGEVVGLIAHGVDVTDRVQQRENAQERAAEAERRYAHAHDVLTLLQRTLLPAGLPVCAGVQIAGSYLPADEESAAGGDWSDAIPLADGRVALVVGDVVGHGVTASATMGQLRAVLVDRLGSGEGISQALTAVDRMARRVPGARTATVCLVVLDQADGTVTYCTAGHPRPLLISEDGATRYLPATGAGPLGTNGEFPTGTEHLDVGEMLLCYSDGIVERPGKARTPSLTELASTAADVATGRAFGSTEASRAERLCTQTIELLVRPTSHSDDITLLAAYRHQRPDDLAASAPATLSAVREMREHLRDWLTDVGASEEDAFVLQHAVGELITNATEHAYSADRSVAGRPGAAHPSAAHLGAVRLNAHLDTHGTATIVVTDNGSWNQPATTSEPTAAAELAGPRGRGLAMSRELVDHLHVDGTDHGTTATITHQLSRPVTMLTAADYSGGHRESPASPTDPESLSVIDKPSAGAARVEVRGPIDADTATQLRAELQHRTRGGTRALTVDLTGVTHLASAGVDTLATAGTSATEGTRPASPPVRLYAPPGSPAQQVLSLTALPHATSDPDEPTDG